MKFIPTKEKCTSKFGILCSAFRFTDYLGKSHCLIERIPKQIKPPSWCKNPNLTRRTKMNSKPQSNSKHKTIHKNPENGTQNKMDCVTQECACGCGLPARYGSKYAFPSHRDNLRNKCRIVAYRELLNV